MGYAGDRRVYGLPFLSVDKKQPLCLCIMRIGPGYAEISARDSRVAGAFYAKYFPYSIHT